VGRVVVCETRRSSLVIRLDVARWEVTLRKDGLIQVMGMQDISWMEEEIDLFTLMVSVSNMWSRSTRAEYGHVVYETLFKYRARFPNHTHYLMKHDVRLLDRMSPSRAQSFGRAPAGGPVEDAERPVEPSDVTSGGNTYESEDVSQEPSVSFGWGSVPRSVHAGAVHNIGVAMVTRSSVARRTSVASPAPPPCEFA
jgi:hypothetical protein